MDADKQIDETGINSSHDSVHANYGETSINSPPRCFVRMEGVDIAQVTGRKTKGDTNSGKSSRMRSNGESVDCSEQKMDSNDQRWVGLGRKQKSWYKVS